MRKRTEQIGRLDRRITIQTVTEVQSSTGAVTQTWADWCTVWAWVGYSKAGSGESEQLAQQNSVNRTLFRIRYKRNLTAKHRICYDGQEYDILFIQEVGRRDFLDIITEQREK